METKNYFLGSVGRVEAFREKNGKLELAFVSKTLTDSGINTSITADDIRAGQGAPIVTRFYHDASVEITLTDVMFKRAYVEAQLGAQFEKGTSKAQAYQTEPHPVAADATTITLDKVPQSMKGGCSAVDAIPVWYAKAGTNDWKVASSVVGNVMTTALDAENAPEKLVEGEYCVRYLAVDSNTWVADIMADIIPEELHLIITVPLYAGDACSASTGKAAGEVQFDIPRFRLNGAQDFAAAMSSNQTMSLAGAALASQTGCDTSAILYTMRILYREEDAAEGFVSIEALDASLDRGEAPVVYGIKSNFEAVLLANENLKFYQGETAQDPEVDALNAAGEWEDTMSANTKCRIIYGSLPALVVEVR